jgi:hypothetical protein
VIAEAASKGWTARLRRYSPTNADMALNQHTPSLWVAMSPSPATIASLEQRSPGVWQLIDRRPGFIPWTDDYASLLPVLRRLQ